MDKEINCFKDLEFSSSISCIDSNLIPSSNNFCLRLSIDNLLSDFRPELKKTDTLRMKKDEENNVRSSIRLST